MNHFLLILVYIMKLTIFWIKSFFTLKRKKRKNSHTKTLIKTIESYHQFY